MPEFKTRRNVASAVGAFPQDVYGIFMPAGRLLPPFIGTRFQTRLSRLEETMDIVFLAAGALLWLLMVLLVWGFRKLERPQGGRP